MASLKLDGSYEFPHGEAFSVRRGVADGLQDNTSRSSLRPTHGPAYRLGRESGLEWRECICVDVSRGIVDEITWDQRGTPPPHPPDASAGYRLGRIFGECLTKKIARAEKPSPAPS